MVKGLISQLTTTVIIRPLGLRPMPPRLRKSTPIIIG